MAATTSPRGKPKNASNRNPRDVPDTERARRRKRQLTTWRIDKIRQLPGQPRIHFDPDEMAALRASIARTGLNIALEVWLPDDAAKDVAELIDGDRRWQTLRDLGIEECDVIIRYPKDREEALDWSEEANANRAPHSPMEIAWRYQRRIDRGQAKEEIGACFGVSVETVDNYAILTQLHPTLQQLISRYTRERDALPLSRARRIARYELSVQLEIWAATKKMTAVKFDAYMASRDAAGSGLADGRWTRKRRPADLRSVWTERLLKCGDQVDALAAMKLEPMFPVATRAEEVQSFDRLLVLLTEHIEKVRARLAALSKQGK